MSKQKSTIIFVLLVVVVGYFYFDFGQYLNLAYIKSQQDFFDAYYENHALATVLGFFMLYVVVTAMSIPGAAILTLLAGALFGLGVGTVVVSFASTIGASMAFLVSRYLFQKPIQEKFSDKLHVVNQGVVRDGAYYLFSLRLVPLFPFFVINAVMGLTKIPLTTFYWVSQVGMLPGTIVYVNAGEQLSQIEGTAGIMSPSLLLSFLLLGIFPLASKKALEFMKQRR